MSTGRLSTVLVWVVIVFFSILIHELGHALTARAYGSEVAIELNAVGGLTSWSLPDGELGPGRRAVVAAAGSAVGVAFGALIWMVASLAGPFGGLAGFAVTRLIWVNLFWGLLNWLPLRPLDGGHLLISLLEKLAPNRAERISGIIFFFTAAAGLAAALWFRLYFAAFLAAWVLMMEFNRRRPAVAPVAIPPLSYGDAVEGDEADAEPVEAEMGEEDGL